MSSNKKSAFECSAQCSLGSSSHSLDEDPEISQFSSRFIQCYTYNIETFDAETYVDDQEGSLISSSSDEVDLYSNKSIQNSLDDSNETKSQQTNSNSDFSLNLKQNQSLQPYKQPSGTHDVVKSIFTPLTPLYTSKYPSQDLFQLNIKSDLSYRCPHPEVLCYIVTEEQPKKKCACKSKPEDKCPHPGTPQSTPEPPRSEPRTSTQRTSTPRTSTPRTSTPRTSTPRPSMPRPTIEENLVTNDPQKMQEPSTRDVGQQKVESSDQVEGQCLPTCGNAAILQELAKQKAGKSCKQTAAPPQTRQSATQKFPDIPPRQEPPVRSCKYGIPPENQKIIPKILPNIRSGGPNITNTSGTRRTSCIPPDIPAKRESATKKPSQRVCLCKPKSVDPTPVQKNEDAELPRASQQPTSGADQEKPKKSCACKHCSKAKAKEASQRSSIIETELPKESNEGKEVIEEPKKDDELEEAPEEGADSPGTEEMAEPPASPKGEDTGSTQRKSVSPQRASNVEVPSSPKGEETSSTRKSASSARASTAEVPSTSKEEETSSQKPDNTIETPASPKDEPETSSIPEACEKYEKVKKRACKCKRCRKAKAEADAQKKLAEEGVGSKEGSIKSGSLAQEEIDAAGVQKVDELGEIPEGEEPEGGEQGAKSEGASAAEGEALSTDQKAEGGSAKDEDGRSGREGGTPKSGTGSPKGSKEGRTSPRTDSEREEGKAGKEHEAGSSHGSADVHKRGSKEDSRGGSVDKTSRGSKEHDRHERDQDKGSERAHASPSGRSTPDHERGGSGSPEHKSGRSSGHAISQHPDDVKDAGEVRSGRGGESPGRTRGSVTSTGRTTPKSYGTEQAERGSTGQGDKSHKSHEERSQLSPSVKYGSVTDMEKSSKHEPGSPSKRQEEGYVSPKSEKTGDRSRHEEGGESRASREGISTGEGATKGDTGRSSPKSARSGEESKHGEGHETPGSRQGKDEASIRSPKSEKSGGDKYTDGGRSPKSDKEKISAVGASGQATPSEAAPRGTGGTATPERAAKEGPDGEQGVEQRPEEDEGKCSASCRRMQAILSADKEKDKDQMESGSRGRKSQEGFDSEGRPIDQDQAEGKAEGETHDGYDAEGIPIGEVQGSSDADGRSRGKGQDDYEASVRSDKARDGYDAEGRPIGEVGVTSEADGRSRGDDYGADDRSKGEAQDRHGSSQIGHDSRHASESKHPSDQMSPSRGRGKPEGVQGPYPTKGKCVCVDNLSNDVEHFSNALQPTKSGLELAIKVAQAKCAEKDSILEYLTNQLLKNKNASKFGEILHKVATGDKNVPDYTIPLLEQTPSEQFECPCQRSGHPQDGCSCNVDPQPLKITNIQRLTKKLILVNWVQSQNSTVIGYEIYINGNLFSIASKADDKAIIKSQEQKIQVTIYAITDGGRCYPEAIAIAS